jgi:hypothetical protein
VWSLYITQIIIASVQIEFVEWSTISKNHVFLKEKVLESSIKHQLKTYLYKITDSKPEWEYFIDWHNVCSQNYEPLIEKLHTLSGMKITKLNLCLVSFKVGNLRNAIMCFRSMSTSHAN